MPATKASMAATGAALEAVMGRGSRLDENGSHMECSVEGCSDLMYARSWCGKHYARWRETGDPETPRRDTRVDLTGQRFGMLRVVGRGKSEDHRTRPGDRRLQRSLWEVLCDCGGTAIVATQRLRNGHTTTCGCRNGMSDQSLVIESVRRIYVRNAAERGVEWRLTAAEVEALIFLPCHYCKTHGSNEITVRKTPWVYNGIDRVDNSKGYLAENAVPCCKTCNFMKGAASRDEFLAAVDRIAFAYRTLPAPVHVPNLWNDPRREADRG